MGDQNFQYFTLDEDSEVEEFVADDPSFKRKVFWYDLLEQTINANSKFSLLIEAMISLLGFGLQIKLLYIYSYYSDWKYFSWTLSALLFTGGLNLISYYKRRKVSVTENSSSQQTKSPVNYSQGRIVKSSKARLVIQIIRQFVCFLMLTPVFNLFYYWTETMKDDKDLKRPLIMRNQPQPTKHEISTVKSIWLNSVQRNYLILLESMLRFLPFAILQIFIVACYRVDETLQNDIIRKPQIYIITWQILYLAWTTTNYADSHFNFTKALQFQDLKENDVSMLFVKVTKLNSFFYFGHNVMSILFRLYCIALLLDTIHFFTFFFIMIMYIIFHGLVSIMPARSRLRYENPPSGLSTKYSDAISRWFNLFCSHNVKQECFIHFTYIFLLGYAIIRFIYLYTNWSSEPSQQQQQFQQEFNNIEELEEDEELFSNYTRLELARECSSELQSLALPIPLLTSVIHAFIQFIIFLSYNCSQHLEHLQNDFAVIFLLLAHSVLSFLYLATLKNRILFEKEFPIQEGYKYWTKWLTKDWAMNDAYEIKKIILCLIASDSELVELRKMILRYRNDGKMSYTFSCFFRSLVCCCPNAAYRRNNLDINSSSKLQIFINNYWELYLEKTPMLSSNDDGASKLFQILERRKHLRSNLRKSDLNVNYYCCDSQLNNLLEFLLENFVLEDDVIRMLTLFIEKFDDYVASTSNSYRLANIEKILQIVTE